MAKSKSLSNLVKSATLASAIATTSGCCAMFNNEKDTIRFNTTPPGATVYINSNREYQTPALIELDRKRDHVALVRKEGYESEIRPIKRRASYWLYADIGWGLLGIYIVPIPIAIEKHYQRYHSFDNVDMELKPKENK